MQWGYATTVRGSGARGLPGKLRGRALMGAIGGPAQMESQAA